jgi:hypothetical protein
MASSRKMMLQSCIIGGSVMMLLLLLGPYIPGPAGSGPPLDPVVLVARVIAADHPDFAINMIKWRSGGRASGGYRDELDNLYGARDTAGWRKAIWTNAIASLRTPGLKLMGMGEAVSLAGLTPDGTDIHTPHNISIYCIYYTGYIGLVVFLFLLYAMWLVGSQLKDDRLRTIYMASFWCTLLVAITGNCLEAPFGAIPIYLFLGVVIGLDRKIAAENKILRRLRAEQAYDDAAEAQAERGGDQIPAFSQYEVMR